MPSLKQLLARQTLLATRPATNDNATTTVSVTPDPAAVAVRLDAEAPVRTGDAPDLHGTRAGTASSVRNDAVARSRVAPRGNHHGHRALRPRRRS